MSNRVVGQWDIECLSLSRFLLAGRYHLSESKYTIRAYNVGLSPNGAQKKLIFHAPRDNEAIVGHGPKSDCERQFTERHKYMGDELVS